MTTASMQIKCVWARA